MEPKTNSAHIVNVFERRVVGSFGSALIELWDKPRPDEAIVGRVDLNGSINTEDWRQWLQILQTAFPDNAVLMVPQQFELIATEDLQKLYDQLGAILYSRKMNMSTQQLYRSSAADRYPSIEYYEVLRPFNERRHTDVPF